jgi:hypothetical protein
MRFLASLPAFSMLLDKLKYAILVQARIAISRQVNKVLQHQESPWQAPELVFTYIKVLQVLQLAYILRNDPQAIVADVQILQFFKSPQIVWQGIQIIV